MVNSSKLSNITKILGLMLFIILFLGITDAVSEEEIIGSGEYRISCLSCHGVGGRGNGPMAELLWIKSIG